MLESQSRSGRKSRGIKKLKQESAPRLQAVDGQGISWKNQSVGAIGAILKVKTKFLEKQVGHLLRKNRKVGALITDLLLLMGGNDQAEALNAARARNESPLVFNDPEGPGLHNRQLRVEAYVGAGNDLVEALTAALQCVIDMILAAQQGARDERHAI